MQGSFTMLVSNPNQIVTTGAYRYVRHPCYLGSLMTILGLSILSPAAGVVSIAWMFFLSRIINEEAILSQRPEYRDYAAKTGMLIPKVRTSCK
jgi:protein-S-isoprenylcysteine O-methyltransferase Ste14